MKRNIFLAAIILVATTLIAVVSCKKEDGIKYSNTPSSDRLSYQPPKVNDMLSYIKDFKQKIQTRGNDETMTLDEAAWHLSSLANYDFGNVRNDASDLRYDTLYSHVAVTNGTVSLADLNAAYNNIASMVESFYQNLSIENAAPRFINIGIEENGTATIALITSYGDWWIYAYYFPNIYDEDSVLNVLGINYDTCFSLEDDFPDELKRVLNLQTLLITAYGQEPISSGRVFYSPTRIDTLAYTTFIDPNGSPYLHDYMILYFIQHDSEVCYDEFAYCFDRYAYAAMQSLGSNEVVINWIELPIKHYYTPIGHTYQCPKIQYGIPIIDHDDPLN
ncbi:MAG: hypothetical protein IKU00_11015 [Bacteroidales bacterium]|nr:hypothetical protein [Bacteroidales bacterium]